MSLGDAIKRRVLYVESSVGGVGGSLHSLWTLLRHLDRTKVDPVVLAFQEIPFWDRFRGEQIRVIVWKEAGRSREVGEGEHHAGSVPQAHLMAPAAGSHTMTVPESAQLLAQPAWRRSLGGLKRLLAEDLPLAHRLTGLIDELRVDILHANDRLGSNRFVALAGWLSGRPVVQHERLVAPYRWTDIVLSGWLAATLCVSHEVARAIRRMGHRGRSIQVVWNAVDSPDLEAAPAGCRSPSVAVVGRVTAWKGQDLFLHAMRRVLEDHPHLEILIVGGTTPGSESFAAELKQIAGDEALAGRVRFTGHVDCPERYIASLSALVVSSRTPEPFGRTVLEAMGLGVPVVAPAAGGPAEVVDDGVTGLLYPPGDALALGAAVATLLEDPERAREMGRKGRQMVRTRFQPESHARQVEAIYRRLAPVEV